MTKNFLYGLVFRTVCLIFQQLEPCVLGAQKNHLVNAALFSIQHTCNIY